MPDRLMQALFPTEVYKKKLNVKLLYCAEEFMDQLFLTEQDKKESQLFFLRRTKQKVLAIRVILANASEMVILPTCTWKSVA